MTSGEPRLRIRLRPPQAGWCFLDLEVGDESLTWSFSRVPADTLRELVEAADAVATGSANRCVVLHEEPSEVELSFVRDQADTVQISIARYRDHRRDEPGEAVAEYTVSASDLARAVWRAFRSVAGRCTPDAYEREWRNAFPGRELDNLTAHVQGRS